MRFLNSWLGVVFLILCLICIGVCSHLDEQERRNRADKMRFKSLRYTDED